MRNFGCRPWILGASEVSVPRRPVAAVTGPGPLPETQSLVDRQYRLVQENRTGTHLDVAARLEVLHHPADHLARGSDHLRDVLLSKLFSDYLLAVHGFRHFEQQVRHSA